MKAVKKALKSKFNEIAEAAADGTKYAAIDAVVDAVVATHRNRAGSADDLRARVLRKVSCMHTLSVHGSYLVRMPRKTVADDGDDDDGDEEQQNQAPAHSAGNVQQPLYAASPDVPASATPVNPLSSVVPSPATAHFCSEYLHTQSLQHQQQHESNSNYHHGSNAHNDDNRHHQHYHQQQQHQLCDASHDIANGHSMPIPAAFPAPADAFSSLTSHAGVTYAEANSQQPQAQLSLPQPHPQQPLYPPEQDPQHAEEQEVHSEGAAHTSLFKHPKQHESQYGAHDGNFTQGTRPQPSDHYANTPTKKHRGTRKRKAVDSVDHASFNPDQIADDVAAGIAQKAPWKGREGQQIKKGSFSQEERDALERAASQLAEEYGHDPSDRTWLLDRKSKKQIDGGKDVWNELAAALPHRKPKQVWAYGYRHWNPGNFKGAWTATEEEMLRQHVAERGFKWAEAGRKIGRLPESCRDKWRMLQRECNKGEWSEEEAQRLYSKVRKQMEQKKNDAGKNGTSGLLPELEKINWEEVAREHGSRNRYQCLQKWYDSLQQCRDDKSGWNPGKDLCLLRALLHQASLGRGESQVDWDVLHVPGVDGAHAQKRWLQIEHDVPREHNKSFFSKLEYVLEHFGGAELRDLMLGPQTYTAKQ